MNISFPDVTPPFAAATPPGSTPPYDYVLGNGNYMCSTLGNKVLVTGDATLYVTGDVKFIASWNEI